ncbi:MAG: hypothetical protein JWQ71_5020 [Pedosphaera sp.]|nr:hypothetical protein [Pedosphaera sp.]
MGQFKIKNLKFKIGDLGNGRANVEHSILNIQHRMLRARNREVLYPRIVLIATKGKKAANPLTTDNTGSRLRDGRFSYKGQRVNIKA